MVTKPRRSSGRPQQEMDPRDFGKPCRRLRDHHQLHFQFHPGRARTRCPSPFGFRNTARWDNNSSWSPPGSGRPLFSLYPSGSLRSNASLPSRRIGSFRNSTRYLLGWDRRRGHFLHLRGKPCIRCSARSDLPHRKSPATLPASCLPSRWEYHQSHSRHRVDFPNYSCYPSI